MKIIWRGLDSVVYGYRETDLIKHFGFFVKNVEMKECVRRSPIGILYGMRGEGDWVKVVSEMSRIENHNSMFEWNNPEGIKFLEDFGNTGCEIADIIESIDAALGIFGDNGSDVFKSLLLLCLLKARGLDSCLCYLMYWYTLRGSKYSWLAELPMVMLLDGLRGVSEQKFCIDGEERVDMTALITFSIRFIQSFARVKLYGKAKEIEKVVYKEGRLSLGDLAYRVNCSKKTVRKYVGFLIEMNCNIETVKEGRELYIKKVTH